MTREEKGIKTKINKSLKRQKRKKKSSQKNIQDMSRERLPSSLLSKNKKTSEKPLS